MNCFLIIFEHGPDFTVFVEIGSANPTKTYTFIGTSGVPFTFSKKGITKTYIFVVVFGDLGGAGNRAPPKVSEFYNKYVGFLTTF